MTTFENALETVLEAARPLDSERVPVEEALGRVLAEDVRSDLDMPPFDKSAMDGYACRRADLKKELTVVEWIPAGYTPTRTIGPGQCAKIMTGAVVPEGADCVVMVEYTETPTPKTMRFTATDTRNNICMLGEDMRKGDRVLEKGTMIAPQHVAVLASVGAARPAVSRRPTVGVIATGDELVEPSAKPAPSQIRNSNSCQLCAQLTRAGVLPRYRGIAKDTEDATERMLTRAMAESDVVLFSGGVSMGDLDLVPGIMRKCGVNLVFEEIAVKPGRPTVFGIADSAICFGLPGNPVSTFILFEILIKPFLYRMMGHDFRPPEIPATLARPVRNKRGNRCSWIPVRLDRDGTATPVEYHGSAHVAALCPANGLISVPVGTTEIREGTEVHVRRI